MKTLVKQNNTKEMEVRQDLIKKLKKAEEQIKNGEVISADVVFKELRKKYGY